MLAEAALHEINELVKKHSSEELLWISGYLAGLANKNGHSNGNVASNGIAVPAASAAPATAKMLTLLYGTETGNAKRAATTAANKLKQSGQRVKLISAEQYKLQDLHKENNLLIIISTQGDGDPPVGAQKFYEHIHSTSEKFKDTHYAVLALGSTSYPQFCKTGIDVDEQLSKLGGKRLLPVVKCDDDFEEDADTWLNNVLQKLTEEVAAPAIPVATPAVKAAEKGKKYFRAKVAANINLNDEGSEKATHHIEFELAEELDYKAGDAAGVIPENDEVLIQKIIGLGGTVGSLSITYRNEEYSLYNLLKKKLNVLYLAERVVKKYAALVQQDIPDTRMDFYDLLRIYPVKDKEQFLAAIQVLDPMVPRLYSISSSPVAHPGELHFTVARDVFEKADDFGYGLGSNYLNQLPVGAELELFLHRQKHFHLPPHDKDLIMIGPGTGIAPLRSFIAERDAEGASGRNWLFFGDQHFVTDFLYQTEIQGWRETGVLQKVSLAFSRDQEEKIYVQHRMQQEAAELWEWINNGAHIAVCGTKNPMSKDVEQALINIIAEHGNLSAEAATGYLNQLGKDGRYAKDVW